MTGYIVGYLISGFIIASLIARWWFTSEDGLDQDYLMFILVWLFYPIWLVVFGFYILIHLWLKLLGRKEYEPNPFKLDDLL